MFTYLSEKARKVIYDVLTLVGIVAAAVAGVVPDEAGKWIGVTAAIVTALLARMASANVGEKGLDTPAEYAADAPAVKLAHAPIENPNIGYVGDSKTDATYHDGK